jgi:hypothetical protein
MKNKIIFLAVTAILLLGSLGFALPIVTDRIALAENHTSTPPVWDLHCYAKAVGNASNYTIDVTWKKNNIPQNLNQTKAVINNTETAVGMVGSDKLAQQENWTCSARAFDGVDYSNWTEATFKTIYFARETSFLSMMLLLLLVGIMVAIVFVAFKVMGK